jgi:hypothetical protein
MVRNNAVRPKATPVDTLHIAVPDSAAAKAKAKAAAKVVTWQQLAVTILSMSV